MRKALKLEKQHDKEVAAAAEKAGETEARRRVFVLDFKGDSRATGVTALREEISAVLAGARSTDEVVLRIENVGGEIDKVTGKRVTFAAFPWRWTKGDGCIVRLVAIVDPSGKYKIETGR